MDDADLLQHYVHKPAGSQIATGTVRIRLVDDERREAKDRVQIQAESRAAFDAYMRRLHPE
jgi:hypothetical protein